jgi:PAS domain S-box-containing protein
MAKANSKTLEVASASESAGLRAELERFKARLELALDAGHMGAWQFDVDTGHVTWTATLEQIHGLPPGTFGGTFADYQRDIHPDDRARVLETITRSLAGTTPHQLLYRIVRPDGEVRWLEASGRLVRAADGRPLQMLGVCCDVTERVVSESQRRELLL